MSPRSSARLQSGHVALLLALSIVLAVSVIGAGVVEVGIGDVRRVAYEQRRQEAVAAAESALDRATLRLRLVLDRVRAVEANGWMEPGRERWRLCEPATPRPPCAADDPGDYESFDARWSAYGPIPDLFAPRESSAQRATASYVARTERPGDATPGWATIHVIAEGWSADGSARARQRRSYQLHRLLWRLPDAPLELTGAADITGDFRIEAGDGIAPQIVAPDTDALSLLFGPAATDVDALRSRSRTVADCGSLGPASQGLLWIAGDCRVSAGGAIGSAGAPVVLVVESGAVQWEAPTEFFGILLLRSSAMATSALQQINGPSTLNGALIADRGLHLDAENLTLRYDFDVLQRLLRLAGQLSEVPGSWTDHR